MSSSVLSSRVASFSATVFSEFSALALQHRAVNLGQGFPDFDGPEEIREVAVRAIQQGENQYSPSPGRIELREAIAEHADRFYRMKVDPNSMVSVTCGATEALTVAFLGLLNPGDEVILFQPFYDSYEAGIVMAGATARHVLLNPPDATHPSWWFDENELEKAFTHKTKLLLLNTPHNPTGKVFTRKELERIAELCLRHHVLVVSDEVYEHLVYAPCKHVRIATLPGMEEKTLTISSGGKTFSLTGWKVGWAIGSPVLRQAVQRAHQFVTFATPAPFQLAIAHALRLPDSYFRNLVSNYESKRDALFQTLRASHLVPYPAEGSYFLMADFASVSSLPDVAFCRQLVEKFGVAAIPPSVFYAPSCRASVQTMARFAFCKSDAVLKEAGVRLARLKGTSV